MQASMCHLFGMHCQLMYCNALSASHVNAQPLRRTVMHRYVASMNVPGGGKNDIPNRLKRQFAIFNVPTPSTDTLNNIFGALVQVRLFSCLFPALMPTQVLSMHPTGSSIDDIVIAPSSASSALLQQQLCQIMAPGSANMLRHA